MLSYFREEAQSRHDHSDNSDDRNKYASHIAMYLCREGLARALIEAISVELKAIGKGEESTLEVEDHTIGSEKLVTASVCDWAQEKGFHIEGWETPRHWRRKSERAYSTEYLDIIDDVIAAFCEPGGEHYQEGVAPKNEAINVYISEKYGLSLSANVIGSISTIVRPGITLTTKR